MSANPIVYCLQHLTDYREFERLCSDVMAGSGYAAIDPLGGLADQGRDALHVCRDDPNDVTIFAYTVRQDWRRKLFEDCARIVEAGHGLNRLAFVCTSTLSASQKDEAKEDVRQEYGWTLELFDLERLRVRLSSDLHHLIAQHPAIFCPPWFQARGGLSIAESRDTLVIDHVAADHAFATWLSRRLQLVGYRTWCYGTAPMAGESADETIRVLIDKRAVRYLPVLSPAAIQDADLVGRCGAACGVSEVTIPCWCSTLDDADLPTKLRTLTPARFDGKWSEGLASLLNSLRSRGISTEIGSVRGREIALQSYVPEPVTLPKPERVFANVFRVAPPPAIIVCDLEREIDDDELAKVRESWAFSMASPTKFLAFEEPPDSVPVVRNVRFREFSWADKRGNSDIRSVVVPELIRRSLEVACYRAGLVRCDNRNVIYFPHVNGPQRNVSYRHVDGRNTWIAMTGERTYGQGENAQPFRYQVAPSFRVGQDETGTWWVTTRIYVRVTNRDGVPFEGKDVIRRRKAVTKSWWNKEWFARTLAIMQTLSGGSPDITVGSGVRSLQVSATPLEWECPISIDVLAVDRLGDFQDEMAAFRYADEEEEEGDIDVDIDEDEVSDE